MTREEAIEILKEWRDIKSCPIIPQSWALDKIVSALEQEPCQVKNELNVELNELKPCDDAVSRRKAISVISACDGKSAQIEALEKLPPVTPSCDKCAMNGSGSKYCDNCKQKSGKWITDARTYYEELNKRGLGVDEYTPYFTDDIACSECLAKYNMYDNETQFFKHCPNCGCRMVEPQESEEQTE